MKLRLSWRNAGSFKFFNSFTGFEEAISAQVLASWKDGQVVVNGIHFTISLSLISEVSGLADSGALVSRDKSNQATEMARFITNTEAFYWLDSGISRASLPKPWDRVAVTIMKYLTLEGKFRKLYGFHIALLNFIRHGLQINIPQFLYASIEKSINLCREGKRKLPLHQGLLKLLYSNASMMAKKQIIKLPTAPTSRKNNSPITKAQLLALQAPPPSSVEQLSSDEKSSSASDGDSDKCSSPPKRKVSTPPPQGARRSARIQNIKKVKQEVVVMSSEETGSKPAAAPPKQLLLDLQVGNVQVIIGSQVSIEDLRANILTLSDTIKDANQKLMQFMEKLASAEKKSA